MLSSKFACLWISRDISSLGNWVVFVALLGWTYQAKESAAIVSVLMLGWLLPPFLLAPVADLVANRRAGQWIAVVAQLLRGAALYSLLNVKTSADLQLVLAAVTLAALPVAFAKSSHDALLPTSIGSEQLPGVEKALSTTRLLTMIIGCAAGTVVFDLAGLPGATATTLVSLLLSAVLLAVARPGHAGAATGQARRTEGAALSTVRDGLAYALQHPALRAVATVRLVVALATGGLVVAQVGFMVWGVMTQPDKIGYVLAATGVGIIVGAAMLKPAQGQFSPNAVVAIALGLAAAAAFGFAISRSIEAVAAFGAVIGFGNGLLGASLASAVAKLAPEKPQRVVSASLDTAVEAGVLLSAIAMGPFADAISPRFAIVLVAIILAVLALYAFGAVTDQETATGESEDRGSDRSLSPSVPA